MPVPKLRAGEPQKQQWRFSPKHLDGFLSLHLCLCQLPAEAGLVPGWCLALLWVDPVTAGCMGWAVVTVPVVLSSWHLEQVNWLPDTKHRNHARLLSVATDGKILVWREERDGQLALAEGFAIVAQQIPRSTRLKKVSSAAHRVSFHKNTLNLGAQVSELALLEEGPGKARPETC